MGLECIEAAVAALQQAGIRAQRGYPAGKMPYLTEPVAGVYIREAQADSITVAARICAPMNRGGTACEDAAILAAQALEGIGGRYQIQSCGFDGKAGLFCQTVLATFTQTVTE